MEKYYRHFKNGKIYEIPREYQHIQAEKAHLEFDGERLMGC